MQLKICQLAKASMFRGMVMNACSPETVMAAKYAVKKMSKQRRMTQQGCVIIYIYI